MSIKQVIHNPIVATIKKNLDHLDRRHMLPSWLLEEIGGLFKPDEPPKKTSDKTTPEPKPVGCVEAKQTTTNPPVEYPSILPNGDRVTPPFETADGHVWRGVLQKNGGHCLERLDIDHPPPEDTFDDQPEVMTCPICGGWEFWQSVAGVWKCYQCDPPKPEAVQFARVAAAIRAKHQK